MQGVDNDVTCIVIPDISQLLGCSTNVASVPPMDELMKTVSENNHRNLKATERARYLVRNFIAISPSMMNKMK